MKQGKEIVAAEGQVEQHHGAVGQIGKCHFLRVAGRIVGGEDRIGRQFCQRFEDHFRGHMQIVGDGHVDLCPHEHGQQIRLMCLDLGDLRTRMGELETAPQFRQQHRRHCNKTADIEWTVDLLGDVGGNIMQGVGLIEQQFGLGKEAFAGGCQGQALRMLAHEELNVEFLLQLADGGRDRR